MAEKNSLVNEYQVMDNMEPESHIEYLPIGYFKLDFEHSARILNVNPEFNAIFGYQEGKSHNSHSLVDHFLFKNEWDDFFDQIADNHHVGGFEVQLKAIDGSNFWASINARLVSSAESQKAWIVGTVEDIDERKFEQLRSITHMEILRQASLSLTASLDLKDVLDTISQCAMDLVPGMRN